jgi:hypothetical protein
MINAEPAAHDRAAKKQNDADVFHDGARLVAECTEASRYLPASPEHAFAVLASTQAQGRLELKRLRGGSRSQQSRD